jgi:hypothetical protein
MYVETHTQWSLRCTFGWDIFALTDIDESAMTARICQTKETDSLCDAISR